jgi:16S rRNA (cytidine1402-2'-O)-methyltransferase
MIFYESPFRLTKTLEQLSEVFGAERRACVSREISKIFEEHCRGTLQELITHFAETPPKGEIVICVEGAEKKKTKKNKYNNEEDTN